MKRRTFLKLAGAGSLSFAAGCTANPENTLYSLVQAPDDMVTGKATWYASTCRECPAGCGVIAKNREGRVIKLEGNPLHPINKGKLCMRGQAALQGVYSPDRLVQPQLRVKGKRQTISFDHAETVLREHAVEAAKKGGNSVQLLTETVGDTLMTLFAEALETWGSKGPVVFEPFAYESLKTANDVVFGVQGLPSYRIEQADVLVGFGADFLETWLSPVSYAAKFRTMHALHEGKKGRFFHVNAYQSLTGANADLWVSCRPGGEAAIALGLLNKALETGRGKGLQGNALDLAKKIAAPYTKEQVLKISGVDPGKYAALEKQLFSAEAPLILGTGIGNAGPDALKTDLAANLLNAALDPGLARLDFRRRHRVETAATRKEVVNFFSGLSKSSAKLLLLNNVDPVFTLPAGSGVRKALDQKGLFVVCFSSFMTETARLADLIIPVRLPLETWDEYSGVRGGLTSTMQPAMGKWTDVPMLGDVVLNAAFGDAKPAPDYKTYLADSLNSAGRIQSETDWLRTIQHGGIFKPAQGEPLAEEKRETTTDLSTVFEGMQPPSPKTLSFMAVPSIRFFDGRGANKSWLCEVPDPLTKVAWQTPLLMHPDTLTANNLSQGDVVNVKSDHGRIEAPVYEYEGIRPGVLAMSMGQGHRAYGRYAENTGVNPLLLLPPETDPATGGPSSIDGPVTIESTGRTMALAHTDGSRIQHGRKIALSTTMEDLAHPTSHHGDGLTMDTFPLTLPLPEGYDPKRDFYPPHDHQDYRWGMVVDLDRCIGCGACSVACYAENNIGVVGVEQIIKGREMSWLRVERYQNPDHMEKITFLPMMCQHCDNAPCESVCPVYAPHHSKEGLNNQIYNRCIGTRFCSQNCPYKVRRFNWFEWPWPTPLALQLNPNVTVRTKGVMEKCSFCIQRIKDARNTAKNENRLIRDGEVKPACVQTCPTGALVFGSLKDVNSRVRKLTADRRAYQVMGYVNTKPAVIYLKKVVQKV